MEKDERWRLSTDHAAEEQEMFRSRHLDVSFLHIHHTGLRVCIHVCVSICEVVREA